QLCKAAFAIKNSTTLILPQWFSVLEDLEIAARMMPRDVRTRWNSTFDMLDFAVEHRVALNTIMGDRAMKLRQYELSEEDWKIGEQLRDIFKDATLFFSRSTPNIATVIPAMDHIDTHLATAASSDTYSVAIKAALAIGKRTLNRYYSKTDQSEVFLYSLFNLRNLIISIEYPVLHPRHKLRYFEKAGWQADWIDEAKSIVQTEFDRSYASLDADWAAPAPTKVRYASHV
ncbi:hypothetical protein GALMADRAFT_75845, partial [Galerina marginata CBS 339.88]